MKRLLLLSTMLFVMLFSCTQVSENVDNNKELNNNQENNTGGNSDLPDDKPKTPITITLVGADGNELKKLEATSGEKVLLSVEVENLSHWNTSRDGSGQSYNGTAVFDESVTLYAILLAENAHTIKYILDDGINNPQNPFSFTEEDYIGIKNPTKAGYTFLGWYDNEDFAGKPIKGWAAGDKTANVTLYAKWQKESDPATEVTITFDINGADVTAPEAITATSGKSVKLPELTGVKFSHWNTNSDDSGLSYKGTAIFTESVTLYAILLAENAYTITYELDGGVNNPKNLFSFTEEDYIGIKNPTKTGYTFLGWYDNKNFTDKPIKGWAAGDKTANVTLYAKWQKESAPATEVTITFDINGADVTAPEAITSTSVESVKLPELTGVKFSHWNTKADGSGLSYKGTATFTESVTLYAILLAENAHTITYELNGGVNHPQNKYSFTEEDYIGIKNPTKDGYKFVGWYDNKNFTGEPIKGWAAGYKTANVILYAKWRAEYTITYELNGGINDSSNPSSFTEDDYIYLCEPTKDSSFFLGWYETADFTGTRITGWSGRDRLANVTLYAKWREGVNNAKYTAGTGVYELRAPKSKIGSTFNTWGGFGVLLLKEDQLSAMVNPQGDGTFAEPTAQLTCGSNLKFPKYASATGNAQVTSYNEKAFNCAWATLTEDDFTFYVDMSKILCDDSAVEVKAFGNGYELMGDDWLKSGQNLDLTGYKPYVIALFDGTSDIVEGETTYAEYVGECSWSTGIWEMKPSTATKPAYFGSFLEEADVSAIDLTTTKQAGATFQLKDASYREANNVPMTFSDGIATAEFTVAEGETDGWGRGCFAVWFQYWAGDGSTLAKVGKQYYAKGTKDANGDVITTLGKALELTDDGSNGGNLAVTDLNAAGTYVITVDARGDIPTIKVEKISDFAEIGKVTGIAINSVSYKTSYNAGESLDVSGLTIKVTKEDGTTKTVNVTSSMVSGFNPLELGTQTLTITYGGCTTTFDVEVHEIETETVEATASNVYDKISGLSSGYYLLKVSGEITSSTIADITSAMNYTSAKIILDLSDTTGLASTGSGTSGSRAFWYCDNLISITLPDGLTSIGSDAFTGCGNLINVVIPESVTEIGHDAFKECSSLISTEIPYGVTTINEETFAYCCSLTSVTIPESVTYIDYSAFQQCSSLTTVNYRGTQEQWEQIVIDYGNTYLKNASVNYNYTGSVLGKVTGITINSTSHKVSYNAGESLDVSGLTIEVTKEDATTKTVKVSSSMVSGFNSLELGTQTLAITYSGCTTTFDVEVIGTTYTIAFDANGGSGTMESLTVIGNIIYKLDEEPFTAPAGYVFNSWNTKADGSGKTYYMNNSYSFSNDMTLYAVWEKVENNFDVSLPGSTSFSISQSTDGDNVTFKCSNWYDSYTWYIDGVKQTSTLREMTVDTSAMKAGIYTIMLKVKYNGTYWSETTTLTVNK